MRTWKQAFDSSSTRKSTCYRSQRFHPVWCWSPTRSSGNLIYSLLDASLCADSSDPAWCNSRVTEKNKRDTKQCVHGQGNWVLAKVRTTLWIMSTIFMKEPYIGFGCKRIIFPFNFKVGTAPETESRVAASHVAEVSSGCVVSKENLQPQKVTCCSRGAKARKKSFVLVQMKLLLPFHRIHWP